MQVSRRLSIQAEDGFVISEDPAPVMRGLVVGADRAGHDLFLERWENRSATTGFDGRVSGSGSGDASDEGRGTLALSTTPPLQFPRAPLPDLSLFFHHRRDRET